MGIELGTAYLTVLPSTKGFGPALNNEVSTQARVAGTNAGNQIGDGINTGTKSRLGAFGGMLKAGLIGAAVGAGLAVGKGIADGIKNASDLNETINKSAVIFGRNAAAMDSWANGAAKNLGMSKQAALEAAAGFGDMFAQLGFSGDEAASMSKSVVQLATDLGSFNNLPTAEVADMISAAFRGEYDSLQRLIPNISAARVEQEAMAMTGKTNASQLTAQEKAAATLAIVQKDGARASGDFAKTQGGLANQQKILAAQWDDLTAKMGQAFLPVLTKLLTFVNDVAIPGVEKFFGALGSAGSTLAPAGGALSGFGAMLQTTVGPALDFVGQKFGEMAAVVAPIIQQVFGAISQKMVEWGPQISTAMTTITGIISSALTLIGTIVGGATALLSWLWETCGATIITIVTDLFANLGTIFSGALMIIQGILDFFIALFTGNWQGMADALVMIGRGLWTMLVGIFTLGKDLVLGILTLLWNLAVGIFTMLRDAIVAIATTAWLWVVDRFNWLKDGVISAATVARDWVTSLFTTLRDNVVNLAQNARDWVTQRFNDLKDTALRTFQAMVDGAGLIWNGLKDAAAKPVRFVIDTVFNNGLIKGWNELVNLLKLDGKLKIAPLNVPGFAKGTTNAPKGWALVGEEGPELVKLRGGEEIKTAAQTRAMIKPQQRFDSDAIGSVAGMVDINKVIADGPGSKEWGLGGPVEWARGMVGAMGWFRRCLAFVNAAWGHRIPQLGVYDARTSMNMVPRQMAGMPPPGAALYWNTGANGHVALADGAGNAFSNDIRVPGRIDLVPQQEINKWGPYMGWWHPTGMAPGSMDFDPGASAGGGGLFALAAQWLTDKLTSPVKGLIAKIPGTGMFVDAAKATAAKLLDLAAEKMRTFFPSAMGGPGQPVSGSQWDVAKALMEAGKALGANRQAMKIALMTVMQESSMQPDFTPDENGDLGLFQNRGYRGDGTPAQLNDAMYSLRGFLYGIDGTKDGHIRGLYDNKNWANMDLGAAAQWVQVSAFPGAYSKHTGTAEDLLNRFGYRTGTSSATPGWHRVGESGPEWVNFAGGETVLPHGFEPSSGGVKIDIHGDVVDPWAMADRLMDKWRDADRRVGLRYG